MITKYSQFEQQNESIKTWIAAATLLVSLGLLPKQALSQSPTKVEKYINDNIDEKDVEYLKFIDNIRKSKIESFSQIENKWKDFSKDSTYCKNVDFKKFLTDVDKKQFPIKVNVFLIDLPIPGTMITVPLYSLDYKMNDELELNLSSTGVGGKVGINYKDKMKIYFLNTPFDNSIGINLNF